MPKDGIDPTTRAGQIAIFRQMTAARRAKETKGFVVSIARDDSTTINIKFNEELPNHKKELLVLKLREEHPDYVRVARWLRTGALCVILRPPRRDVDPDSRRAARCDIPVIVNDLFARVR